MLLLEIDFFYGIGRKMTAATFSLIFIAFTSICVAQNEESKIVTIAQGPVRGYKANDSDVFEFYGIPYATAPNGRDKFKAPLEAPTWTQTLEAVDDTIACPQHPFFGQGLNVQEDCLVANVLVPDTQETSLPVLVIIHGGGFHIGSGQGFSSKPLVESKRIISVTFNYRLGAHGFLCLGTEDIPGNAGLKDMLALLRWVKSNIADFGGNPDDVTLLGYSSGAAAADLLMLSKPAEGLFNKVIPESAASVATWSVQIDPIKVAQDYARKLNFNNVGNLAALEEFYKTASYELLHSDLTLADNTYSDLEFSACVERHVGQEIVLDDSPVNIIKRGDYKKIPVLYGFANMEGRFRMRNFDSWARKMNDKFEDFLTRDLQFEDTSEMERVSQTIKEFYFGDQNVGLYTLFDYLNFFTDVMFAYPILRSAKLHVESGSDSIYLYEYTFYKKFPPIKGVPDVLVNFPGADHCAQTDAIQEAMSIHIINTQNYTEEYELMRAQIRELWLNFIITGNPVPEGSAFPAWPPTNASRTPYMIIGETIELGESLYEQRFQFWDNIYDQYYRHPEKPKDPTNTNSADGASALSKSTLLCLILVYSTQVSFRF